MLGHEAAMGLVMGGWYSTCSGSLPQMPPNAELTEDLRLPKLGSLLKPGSSL